MNNNSIKILFLIALLSFNSCLLGNAMGDGTDTIIKESSNSNHSKKVILFLREAGATVENSYQVSLLGYQTKFDTTMVGNVFTCDDDHGKTYLNHESLNIHWISNDSFEIIYDKRLRTFIKEKSVAGTTIIYKTK